MENARTTMDPRIMDIIISAAAFAVLLVLIEILPLILNEGIAYLVAIIVFIGVMSMAGIMLNRKAK